MNLLISDLVRIVQDDEAQRLAVLLDHFNPFEVLRIGHYELRHTNTLAWLLDPSGNHGLGEAFLRAVVQRLGAQQGDMNLAHLFETAADRAVTLRREVPLSKLIKAAPKSERLGMEDRGEPDEATEVHNTEVREGAIDILLEGDGWVLAIEAKVRSAEGRQQLSRYRNALSEYTKGSLDGGRACFHIYLTVEGDAPSDGAWQIATWREHVIAPLEAVLAIRPALQPPVLKFLESYLETLCRHAGDGDEAETTAAKIAMRFTLELRRVQSALGANPIDPAAERIVRRHAPLLRLLLDQLVSPQAARAEVVKGLMKQFNFRCLDGPPSYMSFVPEEWSRKFPNMIGGSGPMVVFKFVNRVPSASVKLQVPGLGENATDQFATARRKLIRLVQEGEHAAVFPQAFYVQRNGETLRPRPPTPDYFSIYSRSQRLSDEGGADVANEFVSACLEHIVQKVEPALREHMLKAGFN